MAPEPPAHRTLAYWGTAVAAVLVTAAVLIGIRLAADDIPDRQAGCAPADAPPSTPDGTAERAPSGGGLRIAEQGFSQTWPAGRVTIGALIENTAGQPAYRTRLWFAALDRDGRPAVTDRLGFRQEIPVILPGQRVSLGAVADVDPAAALTEDKYPVVTRVQIQLTSTRWITAPGDNPLFQPITARVLDGGNADSTQVSYTVGGADCPGLVHRGTAMVFRAGNGAIIGGALDTAVSGDRCRGLGATQLAHADDIPEAIDGSKTSVSVYCDSAAAPTTPNPTTGPLN